jgi:ABC-type sugar transport system ATPase subunit
MTTVSFDHVTKRFRQSVEGASKTITAVNNVSLKLTAGDVMAILGPSGCGKTTLLRLIAGLEVPDEGELYFDNVALREIEVKERGIGMVFQNGALMPHWEGWQTVGFFLSLRQREREVPDRVAQVSKITGIGIEALLNKKPKHLSGGERQRVGIARALARDPRVFLFDEPFANLDAKIRAQSRVELKRLLNEFPVTSVYVTHDQVEAIALSDRIAVMRAGRIEQVGTYQQLYSNPVNLFVGSFVGTPLMNEFPGRVVDGMWQGRNFGGYDIRHDLESDTRITMGIRPENIRLVSEGVPAVVDQVTPFFAERYNLVDVGFDKEHWQLTVPLDDHVEVGSTVHCDLDRNSILFFDTRTGARVG